MCGIAGILFTDRSRKAEENILRKMTDVIIHRGPDDEGFYTDGPAGLGFRRLSIIDLHTGHQPLSNEDGSIWIVFNGEIYNYQELQSDLIRKGHRFATQSDTETIVHLYEEFGTACVEHLQGMFGFAIWDSRKQQLFCARDRFGIKPFYYYNDGEKFVFGSEIKSILQVEGVDRSLSMEALQSYFAYGYISDDLSIYTHIRKLRPAHSLLIRVDQPPVITKYWSVQMRPDHSLSADQWAERIRESLSGSVKSHMVADVPLGAFLSGGLDSSSVVATMAAHSTQPIKTFSIGFREEKYNELQYARELAKRYNCEHHEQIVEPESISLLPKLVRAYDEPFADASAIPTYYVSKFAREHVTVVLSGDGGDELFAGYDIYSLLKKIRRYSLPFPALNKMLWGSVNKLIPQQMKGKGLSYFLSQDREKLGAYVCPWPAAERKKLFLPGTWAGSNGYSPEAYKESVLHQMGGGDFISGLQYMDMHTYMVDDVLTKVDRASMLNSIEVRVPLLDHKFAELSFQIPSDLKLNGDQQKYIFRKAVQPLLPENVFNHPKQGFSVPLSVWFKSDLKEYVNDTLLHGKPRIAEYLDTGYLREILKGSETGSRDFSGRIWSLLVFEEWLNQQEKK